MDLSGTERRGRLFFINMDMYNSESGTYQVHAYAETAHEEEVFLGEGTVEVYKAGSAR